MICRRCYRSGCLQRHPGKYDTLTEAVDTEKANATFTSLLNDYETKYTKGIETGTSAANISGIKKTGDYSMTVSLTQSTPPPSISWV